MAAKISVYSLSELKTTIDDHIPIYLTSPNLPPSSTPLAKHLRFAESHFLTTVRLALGYSAVAIALYIFYLDYYLKVPWAEHKNITVYAVFSYFIINCILTAWIWLAERSAIFVGSRAPSKTAAALDLRLSSHAPKSKFQPVYRLGAEWTTTSTSGKRESNKIDAEVPFRLFFQADGTFVSGEFERWLRKTLPVIAGELGKVGPTGNGEDILGPKVVVNSPPESEEMIIVDSDLATTSQSGRDAAPGGSAKKRSKKKG